MDALPEPLERKIAVASLRAGVLSDSGHTFAETVREALLLLCAERYGRLDLEDRLDPRSGDVCVLAAGSRRAARPQLDLTKRDGE